jgi:hypothetical protein
MTNSTQYLYISWVSPKRWCCAMRFYMVSLQILYTITILALTTFCNHLRYSFSTSICSRTRATVPFRMINPPHRPTPNNGHTGNRAVLPSTTVTFSNLKLFTTFFTYTIKNNFRFAGFYFFRAFPRAGVGVISNVCVRAGKFYGAHWAYKRSTTTGRDFSLGV